MDDFEIKDYQHVLYSLDYNNNKPMGFKNWERPINISNAKEIITLWTGYENTVLYKEVHSKQEKAEDQIMKWTGLNTEKLIRMKSGTGKNSKERLNIVWPSLWKRKT